MPKLPVSLNFHYSAEVWKNSRVKIDSVLQPAKRREIPTPTGYFNSFDVVYVDIGENEHNILKILLTQINRNHLILKLMYN